MAESKTQKLSVFARAWSDRTFANVAFEPSDIRALRPAWSEQQCAEFLAAAETQIAASALAGGWSAIAALLDQLERKKGE